MVRIMERVRADKIFLLNNYKPPTPLSHRWILVSTSRLVLTLGEFRLSSEITLMPHSGYKATTNGEGETSGGRGTPSPCSPSGQQKLSAATATPRSPTAFSALTVSSARMRKRKKRPPLKICAPHCRRLGRRIVVCVKAPSV